MPEVKKHIQIILIVVVTITLIVIVIWLFSKRIDDIERKIKKGEASAFSMFTMRQVAKTTRKAGTRAWKTVIGL